MWERSIRLTFDDEKFSLLIFFHDEEPVVEHQLEEQMQLQRIICDFSKGLSPEAIVARKVSAIDLIVALVFRSFKLAGRFQPPKVLSKKNPLFPPLLSALLHHQVSFPLSVKRSSAYSVLAMSSCHTNSEGALFSMSHI